MIGSEALGVTRQVTAALDTLGVGYVIGGSLARIVHGRVRVTVFSRPSAACCSVHL